MHTHWKWQAITMPNERESHTHTERETASQLWTKKHNDHHWYGDHSSLHRVKSRLRYVIRTRNTFADKPNVKNQSRIKKKKMKRAAVSIKQQKNEKKTGISNRRSSNFCRNKRSSKISLKIQIVKFYWKSSNNHTHNRQISFPSLKCKRNIVSSINQIHERNSNRSKHVERGQCNLQIVKTVGWCVRNVGVCEKCEQDLPVVALCPCFMINI